MTECVVRVTRSWDVTVPAEYGDDEAAIMAKAQAGTPEQASETRSLMPKDATPVATSKDKD